MWKRRDVYTTEASHAEIILIVLVLTVTTYGHTVQSVLFGIALTLRSSTNPKNAKKRLKDLGHSTTLDGHRKSLSKDVRTFREFFGYRNRETSVLSKGVQHEGSLLAAICQSPGKENLRSPKKLGQKTIFTRKR